MPHISANAVVLHCTDMVMLVSLQRAMRAREVPMFLDCREQSVTCCFYSAVLH